MYYLFNKEKRKFVNKVLKITLFVLMILVFWAGLTFSVVPHPTGWNQFPDIPGLGQLARIIIFHVPTAWLASIAFLMATIYGIKYLMKKDLDDDARSFSALQIGMVFAVLATLTGSIWAKFTWGSFWNWDPRETSIFVLLLIYGSLFALRSAIESEDKRARLSAVYAIFSFLTVPFLVFVMPRIMNGLHPGSADDTNAGPVVDFKMNGNMMGVFFLSLIAFSILYYWMWKTNYKSIIIKEKLNNRKRLS
jgi:heme exporter protein C